MPRLPGHPASAVAVRKVKLGHLPEDLLAHVLRFTTASVRRDGLPGRPASVLHLRFAAISPAFRRAFLRHLESLVLDHPACRRLAGLHWGPLRACTALRKVVVARSARVTDEHLVGLWRMLAARGVFLRDVELELTGDVTAVALTGLVGQFGAYITRLAVVLVQNPSAGRRVQQAGTTLPALHLEGANGADAPPPPNHALLPFGHAMGHAMGGAGHGHHFMHPVFPQHLHGPHPPAPAVVNPVNPVNPNVHFPQQVPALVHVNLGFGGAMAAASFNSTYDRSQLASSDTEEQDTSIETGDDVPIHSVPNDSEDDNLERLARELNTHREFARNFADVLGDVSTRCPEPNINIVAHGGANECIVTDDVFKSVFSSLPNLEDLTLVRVRTVGPRGFKTLLHCPKLQKLQLASMIRIPSESLGSVLRKLGNLRELSLCKMVVEDKAMADLVRGPSGSKFETLKLVLMDRITDATVRRMVNNCPSMSSFNFMMCSSITNRAASHIACAPNVESVMLSPYDTFPVSSSSVVHMSCARVLRSLSLGNCKLLGVDCINALANLPALSKLHMTRLGGLSLDVMKALGGFPRLDDLLLQGQLGLSDLGVKLLCGLRGHRFIHLALADTTKGLCEDGLDHIMTWCTSLRTLEVYGNFKEGVLDRLRDGIPHANIRVQALVKKHGGFVQGDRSVWD